MPTGWASTALSSIVPLLPEYEASVGHIQTMLGALPGKEVGDLKRYAQVIFDLSRKDALPNHLLLGSDALFAVRKAETARDKAMAEWQHISRSTDRVDADLSFLDQLSH